MSPRPCAVLDAVMQAALVETRTDGGDVKKLARKLDAHCDSCEQCAAWRVGLIAHVNESLKRIDKFKAGG